MEWWKRAEQLEKDERAKRRGKLGTQERAVKRKLEERAKLLKREKQDKQSGKAKQCWQKEAHRKRVAQKIQQREKRGGRAEKSRTALGLLCRIELTRGESGTRQNS